MHHSHRTTVVRFTRHIHVAHPVGNLRLCKMAVLPFYPPPGTITSKETRIRQRVRVFFFLPQVDAASGGRNTARSGVKL